LVEPIIPPQVRIGACLRCRQLFLVTYDSPSCYLCGDPPAYTLPFTAAAPSAQPEPVEGLTPSPPAAPPTLIGITCPHCHSNVQLSISDSEISVVPPPLPVADEEPAEPAAAPDQPVESDELVPPLAGYGSASADADSSPSAAADDRTTVPSP
jgi:hypothetical protein